MAGYWAHSTALLWQSNTLDFYQKSHESTVIVTEFCPTQFDHKPFTQAWP
jgi:hypothetical protein